MRYDGICKRFFSGQFVSKMLIDCAYLKKTHIQMFCIFTKCGMAKISSFEGCVLRGEAAPAFLGMLLPYIVVGATYTL